MSAIEFAKSYGYSIEGWDVFVNDKNLPEGLLDRALEIKSELEADGADITYVLYDVEDNDQGFILLGNNAEELALNAIDGPLSDCEGSEQYLKPTKGVSFH